MSKQSKEHTKPLTAYLIVVLGQGIAPFKMYAIEEKTLKEEMDRIKDATRKPKKKDCKDGQHCQKICSETELGPLLSEGWHVVTALPSGKIVIER